MSKACPIEDVARAPDGSILSPSARRRSLSADDKCNEELGLARCLGARTRRLCRGLEDGRAKLLDLVTPTTAALLYCWFGTEPRLSRRVNFRPEQRQAILNTIVAHEVLGATSLLDLYWRAAPDALLADQRIAELSRPECRHPQYALSLAAGKSWVLQALLVWQLLNKLVVLEEGSDDPRFARHFLIVTPGPITHARLLDALHGRLRNGGRDFQDADLSLHAELFIPHAYRAGVFGFLQDAVRGRQASSRPPCGMLAIVRADWLAKSARASEASEATSAMIADLPELMAFSYRADHIRSPSTAAGNPAANWQTRLGQIAAAKGRRFVQVDFSAPPWSDPGFGTNRHYPPHIIA